MIALLQIATGTGLLISGIISGLAALGGGAAALYSRKKTEERQNQYNLDAEKRQQKYMDDANEYNSPVEQMNRFREAGLNPYLVDDPGNQGEVNSAITNTALDRSDIILDNAQQIGDTATSTGQAFQSALLEEKKYQLDVAKLDAQKAQFEEQMNFHRSRFDYDQSRDQIDDAYRTARNQVNDTYNQSIFELRQKELTFEQEKEERRKLESDRDYNLKLAADGRDAALHDLQVEYFQTRNNYNNDAYKFFKDWELPNKEAQAKIEKLVYSMSDEEQKEFVKCAKETLRLKTLQTSNKISYEEYLRDARKLWDDTADSLFKTKHARYLRGEGLSVNPYNQLSGGQNVWMQAAEDMMKFAK